VGEDVFVGRKEELYQNASKTLQLDDAKASQFNDRKRVHIKFNIDPFAIVELRELSRSSNVVF
jgi:hypothetical protein